jgi:large repetitive protein
VAPDGSGGFMVAWESQAQDGSLFGIFGRSFDASGAGLDASEFLVNTLTAGSQRSPAMAAAGGGRFVVAWQSPPDGSGYGVRAQRYGDLIFEDGFDQ